MNTQTLIKQLQDLDPSGLTEVAVGCEAIHFIERLPAYYDGALETLQIDEKTHEILNKNKLNLTSDSL